MFCGVVYMRMRCDASRDDDDENQKMNFSKFHFNFIISHHITITSHGTSETSETRTKLQTSNFFKLETKSRKKLKI